MSGHIRFVGTPPERKMIDVSTCQTGTKALQEETIVVGVNGGLKEVVITLNDAPTTSGNQQLAATLDQIDCRYVPHVLALQVGQPLSITSSDSCFHNVYLRGTNTEGRNYNFQRAGIVETVNFDRPGIVETRCNVHPWMNASIVVTGSPFFAVSAADGSFTISRVPAGRYEVVAWHPILGKKTATIDVAADGAIEVNFEFGT